MGNERRRTAEKDSDFSTLCCRCSTMLRGWLPAERSQWLHSLHSLKWLTESSDLSCIYFAKTSKRRHHHICLMKTMKCDGVSSTVLSKEAGLRWTSCLATGQQTILGALEKLSLHNLRRCWTWRTLTYISGLLAKHPFQTTLPTHFCECYAKI